MQLSDQALGAVMMALQKSLMEQSDIVPVLKGFRFQSSDTGLVVMNPPIVKFNDDFERLNTISEEPATPPTATMKTTKTKTKKKATTKTRAKKAPSRRAPSKKRSKATVKVNPAEADDS